VSVLRIALAQKVLMKCYELIREYKNLNVVFITVAAPILDVSTKLEITDRYLSWQEDRQIARLSAEEVIKLKNLINTVNYLCKNEFARLGFVNEDGKIEASVQQPASHDAGGRSGHTERIPFYL